MAKVSYKYGIYVHQLVIKGVTTIVNAIIVTRYTAFRAQSGHFCRWSKKIARANIKFHTKYELFLILNQIANFEICDFAKAGSIQRLLKDF